MEVEANKKILVVGFLFLLFPPHLIIFGYYIKTVYISVLIPGIIGLIIFLNTKKINKIIIYTLYVLIIQFIIFYFNYEFNIYKDSSILIRQCQGLICFFAAYFYIYIISKNNSYINKEKLVLDSIIYAAFINSIILLLTKFFPLFKEILYQYIGITNLAYQYMFSFKEIARYQGIVHSGFSFLSTVYGIIISINLMLLYKYKERNYIILLLINLIALMDIGRSGYIPIIITSFYLLIDLILKGSKINFGLLIKIFIMLIFFIIYIYTFSKDIYWIIEPFNIFRYDQSTIGNILAHKISYPDNILFGNGNFGINPNFPNLFTDSGYETFLNAAGILGYLTAYLLIIPVYLLWLDKYISSNLKSLTLIIILSFFILNFKDYYYYGYGDIFQILFLLIFTSIFTNSKYDNPFYYKIIFKF